MPLISPCFATHPLFSLFAFLGLCKTGLPCSRNIVDPQRPGKGQSSGMQEAETGNRMKKCDGNEENVAKRANRGTGREKENSVSGVSSAL